MRGVVRSIHVFLVVVALFTVACGGGGGIGGVQSPPPAPDFSLTLSSTSISVSRGSTSPPVSVSIAPQNGFSDSVQVSFTGLPSGVTSNPASLFSVAAGQSVSVLFGAESSAPTGQFGPTAQGTSGALSHSRDFSLAIQFSRFFGQSDRRTTSSSHRF